VAEVLVLCALLLLSFTDIALADAAFASAFHLSH